MAAFKLTRAFSAAVWKSSMAFLTAALRVCAKALICGPAFVYSFAVSYKLGYGSFNKARNYKLCFTKPNSLLGRKRRNVWPKQEFHLGTPGIFLFALNRRNLMTTGSGWLGQTLCGAWQGKGSWA